MTKPKKYLIRYCPEPEKGVGISTIYKQIVSAYSAEDALFQFERTCLRGSRYRDGKLIHERDTYYLDYIGPAT